jgi:hypothetical protein
VTVAAIDSTVGFTGRVTPDTGAVWSQAQDGPAERVTLSEGRLDLSVSPQRPGARFVVELPDGEIEVRGTRFDVTVANRRTHAVHVLEGTVALRIRGADEVLLHHGDSWTERPAPAVTVSVTRRAPVLDNETATSTAYKDAVAAYHAKRYAEAADKLSSFVVAHPEVPEAEDARFLEASALAHDGRADAAGVAAERFLARYPASFHAKDAAILAARIARDRGDCAHASALLARWRDSADAQSALGACARPVP